MPYLQALLTAERTRDHARIVRKCAQVFDMTYHRERKAWIAATTSAPSPIAPSTRLTEPERGGGARRQRSGPLGI